MISKVTLVVLVSLLSAAPCWAQFTASSSLQGAVEQSIGNANANISSFVAANNIAGAAFWYADDAEVIIQNLTLSNNGSNRAGIGLVLGPLV